MIFDICYMLREIIKENILYSGYGYGYGYTEDEGDSSNIYINVYVMLHTVIFLFKVMGMRLCSVGCLKLSISNSESVIELQGPSILYI